MNDDVPCMRQGYESPRHCCCGGSKDNRGMQRDARERIESYLVAPQQTEQSVEQIFGHGRQLENAPAAPRRLCQCGIPVVAFASECPRRYAKVLRLVQS